MRKGLGALFLLVCINWVPGAAAADMSSTAQITVTATVLPARFIIIDNHNHVTEVLSNSRQEVQPTVYLHNIARGNQQPLSSAIYNQYLSLVPAAKRAQSGVLYKLASITKQPKGAGQDALVHDQSIVSTLFSVRKAAI
jgi:hypothetical protein